MFVQLLNAWLKDEAFFTDKTEKALSLHFPLTNCPQNHNYLTVYNFIVHYENIFIYRTRSIHLLFSIYISISFRWFFLNQLSSTAITILESAA